MAEVPLSEPDVSAHVVLSLSFDYNVALSKFLVFGREVEAVVSNGNARTEEEKQVSADACEKIEKVIGPKRKHAADEGSLERVTRARTRGTEARGKGLKAGKRAAAKKGAKGEKNEGANTDDKVAAGTVRACTAVAVPESSTVDHLSLSENRSGLHNGNIPETQTDVALESAVCPETKSINDRHGQLADEIVNDSDRQCTTAVCTVPGESIMNVQGPEERNGPGPGVQSECDIWRFALQPIAETSGYQMGKNTADDIAMSEDDGQPQQKRSEVTRQQPLASQSAGVARQKQCMSSGEHSPASAGNPDAAILNGSPSLGAVHARPPPEEAMGDASGDENWPQFASDDDVSAGGAVSAGPLCENENDLPCADEGDAHAVDLDPHESPSPLPHGVWDENPESSPSISLPQLNVGRTSRNSTPKLFDKEKESNATRAQNTARKSPQVAPIADLQNKLQLLDSRASTIKKPPRQSPGKLLNVASKSTDERSASGDAAGPHKEVPSCQAGNGTSRPVNFFQGGSSLVHRLREQEPAHAADLVPASGNHGKSVIKSLQIAEKKRMLELKQIEEREARKKANQDLLAAKKAHRAMPTGLKGLNKADGTAGALVSVAGKPQAPGRVPAPSSGVPVQTPERAAPKAVQVDTGNVTPTNLRHALASGWRKPSGNFGLKRPTPCAEQYPLTPFSELGSGSDDESGATKVKRARKARPGWAVTGVLAQKAKAQRKVNPETILGKFEPTCDLMELFGKDCTDEQRLRYTSKRASRDWGSDAVTEAQIQAFNAKKGYRC